MMTIENCRLCGSSDLIKVFELGDMAFSGIFPKHEEESVPYGILSVVLCDKCKLAQLDQNFPSEIMYGSNYGYMSSLNNSMRSHLKEVVRYLEGLCTLNPGDVVLDIGSNDATLLKLYENTSITRVGIDPTIQKFQKYYDESIISIADFFSASKYFDCLGDQKAKIISSIAMFYDLPDPIKFTKDIRDVISDDGVWYLEVSYGPEMLRSGAFDSICHEHLEYYSLHTLKQILDLCDFKIIDCKINAINGGSIAITAAPKNSKLNESIDPMNKILSFEQNEGSNSKPAWDSFKLIVEQRLKDLRILLEEKNNLGQRVVALGASTKGNILLQSLPIDVVRTIEAIGEVNTDKIGCFTPGTKLKIISESEVLATPPDFILILPWHFKTFFDHQLTEYMKNGGKVIYPLPVLVIEQR